jgi:hypothetical protein
VSRTVQRLVIGVGLLLAGMVSLPLSAYFLDGPATENLVLPAQLAGMAVLGAALGTAAPAISREGATAGRRALVGAGWGLLAAVVGVAVFWFLLNGLGGA